MKTSTENRSIRHGMFGTKTYRAWVSMKSRCLNKNHRQFADYGGRGITVCESWAADFKNFLADMGVAPEGLTLERRDNEMGYFKDNCRWATPQEQALNRRAPSTTKALPGVFFDAAKGVFRAHLMRRRTRYDLGTHVDFFEACCARKSAEARFA